MKQTRGTNGVAESGSPAQIPRRGFVKGSLGVAGFAATAAVLAACADNNVLNPDNGAPTAQALKAQAALQARRSLGLRSTGTWQQAGPNHW